MLTPGGVGNPNNNQLFRRERDEEQKRHRKAEAPANAKKKRVVTDEEAKAQEAVGSLANLLSNLGGQTQL